ncbi:MAG TPA: DUF1343 domain-containing protein [Mariniphaga sp.]|nr:DUF1343 domain-containing protein [Mariniphaga sp.]
MLIVTALLFTFLFNISCTAENQEQLLTGAEQPEAYLPLIKGKRVGLVVNHTSTTGDLHLIDFLRERDINIVKILAPEHGFRGTALEGELIEDGMDKKTGIPVISLYGKNRKPTPEHLADVDIIIFDIQDVGARFYTYISTMHLVMEACAESNKKMIVFDRPNPNGDYIDGPILDPKYQSFVGMHPIPVVHGCTIGELASMINEEQWLSNNEKCDLTVIPVKNYNHNTKYSIPVPPSPNLPNDLAIRLYPSLCFFEATSVSVGRGTEFPFQVLGGLRPELGDFTFIPESTPNSPIKPLNEGKVCYGIDLRKIDEPPTFTLKYFLDFYNKYPDEKEFLIRENWLNTLAGTNKLLDQIRQGLTESEIKASWQHDLDNYRELRKKYLLYPDFN